jgi:hypothetical protein
MSRAAIEGLQVTANLGYRSRWLRVSWPGQTEQAVSRGLSRLVDHAIRPLHPEFEYLRVIGLTKSGIPHAHTLFRSAEPLPWKWLSEAWGDVAGPGAWRIWVEEISNPWGTVRYLAKNMVGYLSRQAGESPWSCSRGWRLRSALASRTGIKGPPVRVGWEALAFVRGPYYSRTRLQPVYVVREALHTYLTVTQLLRALA